MGLRVPTSHPRRGLPVCTVGERSLPALSIPPAQSASVPPSAHPGPPSTLDRKDPGMAEAGSCPPIRVPVNSTQAVQGSVGWQVLGGRQQTTLCPTGTDLPCHRLPKGAPAPPPPFPGAAIESLPSRVSALATLGPPAGPPSPGPHCPHPSPGCPVAT